MRKPAGSAFFRITFAYSPEVTLMIVFSSLLNRSARYLFTFSCQNS